MFWIWQLVLETSEKILDNRNIINSILEQEYRINLNNIADKLLDEALKLTKGMHLLLITTGKFNLPLVEKLLLEAGKRGIYTTLIYQDLEQLQARGGAVFVNCLFKRTMRILTKN